MLTRVVMVLFGLTLLLAAPASAAVDGVFVSQPPGALEYLSLTTTGNEVTGYLQSFTAAASAAGGVARTRRDLTGTVQGNRIVLHTTPTWMGGGSLTGEVGWGVVTLHFPLSDGTIGHADFRQMTAEAANALIAQFTGAANAQAQRSAAAAAQQAQRSAAAAAQAAAAAVATRRANGLASDLQDAQSQQAQAQAQLPQAKRDVATATLQLQNATAALRKAQAAEQAARDAEASERATEEQMRTQEMQMPIVTRDDHDARLAYHQQVLEQHDKVNNVHAAVNDAHGVTNDASSTMRMLQNTLAGAQRFQRSLENAIASAAARAQSDRAALATR